MTDHDHHARVDTRSVAQRRERRGRVTCLLVEAGREVGAGRPAHPSACRTGVTRRRAPRERARLRLPRRVSGPAVQVAIERPRAVDDQRRGERGGRVRCHERAGKPGTIVSRDSTSWTFIRRCSGSGPGCWPRSIATLRAARKRHEMLVPDRIRPAHRLVDHIGGEQVQEVVEELPCLSARPAARRRPRVSRARSLARLMTIRIRIGLARAENTEASTSGSASSTSAQVRMLRQATTPSSRGPVPAYATTASWRRRRQALPTAAARPAHDRSLTCEGPTRVGSHALRVAQRPPEGALGRSPDHRSFHGTTELRIIKELRGLRVPRARAAVGCAG